MLSNKAHNLSCLFSHLNLEPCVEVILALKKKVLMSLLTTSLGSSVILTLILKASLLKGEF